MVKRDTEDMISTRSSLPNSTARQRRERTYRLGLLVEDGLGLTTVTALLSWMGQPLCQFLLLLPLPRGSWNRSSQIKAVTSSALRQCDRKEGPTVISSLSLGGQRVLALLVLRDLVGRVLLARLALAVWTGGSADATRSGSEQQCRVPQLHR